MCVYIHTNIYIYIYRVNPRIQPVGGAAPEGGGGHGEGRGRERGIHTYTYIRKQAYISMYTYSYDSTRSSNLKVPCAPK